MTHPFFLRSTLKSTHMIIGTAYVYTVHHKRVPLRDIWYVRAQLIGKIVNLALGVIWGPVHGDNHDRSSAHEAVDQPHVLYVTHVNDRLHVHRLYDASDLRAIVFCFMVSQTAPRLSRFLQTTHCNVLYVIDGVV